VYAQNKNSAEPASIMIARIVRVNGKPACRGKPRDKLLDLRWGEEKVLSDHHLGKFPGISILPKHFLPA